MTNPHQIETKVFLRKNQAKDMFRTLSLMSSEESNNCDDRVDASTWALRAYYQQPVASKYNLNEALDALVTLTDRSQKLVHAEQKKKFLELSNKPSLALYTGCPGQFVPDQIKNQRLQPFLPPPRDRSQSRPTQAGRKSILRTGNKRDSIRTQGVPSQGRTINKLKKSRRSWNC